jgi:hypothetical protein
MSSYVCPRCQRIFSRNSILQNHLKRKKQCELVERSPIYDSNDQSAPNQHTSTLVDVTCPTNSRKTPVKITKNSRKINEKLENSRKTPVKFTINPENSRLTKTFLNNIPETTENNNDTETDDEFDGNLPLDDKVKIICEFCYQSFGHKNSYYRHRKHYCQMNPARQELLVNDNDANDDNDNENDDDNDNDNLSSEIWALKKRIKELEKNQQTHSNDLVELKDYPRINQNVLQVVCVGSNDNYLDMLTERLGNFDQALEYVKDCALSSLNGDCRLLEKIYFQENNNNAEMPIRYLDRSRQKITYLDENGQRIIDIKGIELGKKLANNLQNSYLKGVNYLIKQNLEQQRCPNKFLNDYDIQSWNSHIYELSDVKYQRKLINQLDIP